ncbi:Uncharacterised protein [Klebsiella michiganensis]|jgi:hypothetical protein|nr:Uncharacterised protein [Klebsiella michiganensis]
MGIRYAWQANILSEVVTFLQRLIDFLLAHGILRELITGAKQAANDKRGRDKHLFHWIP